jgi:hypothetical protein
MVGPPAHPAVEVQVGGILVTADRGLPDPEEREPVTSDVRAGFLDRAPTGVYKLVGPLSLAYGGWQRPLEADGGPFSFDPSFPDSLTQPQNSRRVTEARCPGLMGEGSVPRRSGGGPCPFLSGRSNFIPPPDIPHGAEAGSHLDFMAFS